MFRGLSLTRLMLFAIIMIHEHCLWLQILLPALPYQFYFSNCVLFIAPLVMFLIYQENYNLIQTMNLRYTRNSHSKFGTKSNLQKQFSNENSLAKL